MLDLANPFSAAWKNARRAKKAVTDYNWKVSSLWPMSLVFSLYICMNCGDVASAQSGLCSLTSRVQGEGLIPGGILVVRSGTGGVVYAHQEQTFGDHAPIAEVRLMP